MALGLEAVRDALLLAYNESIIDDEEFALLYDYNQSKPLYPYWMFDAFTFDSWNEAECEIELRFKNNDLASLMDYLQIPEKLVCRQGTVCSGLEGLLILLKRLAYPCQFTDMTYRFGRSPPELYLIFNKVLDLVYAAHHHRL